MYRPLLTPARPRTHAPQEQVFCTLYHRYHTVSSHSIDGYRRALFPPNAALPLTTGRSPRPPQRRYFKRSREQVKPYYSLGPPANPVAVSPSKGIGRASPHRRQAASHRFQLNQSCACFFATLPPLRSALLAGPVSVRHRKLPARD